MKHLILLAGLLLALPAQAQTVDAYGRVLTCTGSHPIVCTASGITAANDSMGPIIGAFNATPPAGVAMWAPTPTTIAPNDFIARLTPAEQAAIVTAGQTNPAINLFLWKLTGALSVDVTDPLTKAGTAAMVAGGLISQARATQILDLSKASP